MPMEAKKIQLEVMEMCDQMEYDGSPMFDCYPDRIIIGRMVQKICGERCNDPYYNALVQVMLCKEMRCRRNRRDCHKNVFCTKIKSHNRSVVMQGICVRFCDSNMQILTKRRRRKAKFI